MSEFGFKNQEERLDDNEARQEKSAELVERAQQLLDEVTDDYAETNDLTWKTREVTLLAPDAVTMTPKTLVVRLDPFPAEVSDCEIMARHIQEELPLTVSFSAPHAWTERYGEYGMDGSKQHHTWPSIVSYDP
jgi:hypothetical protein